MRERDASWGLACGDGLNGSDLGFGYLVTGGGGQSFCVLAFIPERKIGLCVGLCF